MTSKISSNKNFKNVLKNELKARKLVLILLPIVLIIATIVTLSIFAEYVQRDTIYATQSYIQDSSTNDNIRIVAKGAINYVCAVLFVILNFVNLCAGYNQYNSFYSKRKTDFIASLPINRTASYLSKTIVAFIYTVEGFLATFFSTAFFLESPLINKTLSLSLPVITQLYFVVALCAFTMYLMFQCCSVTSGKLWQYILLCVMTQLAPFGIAGVLYMPKLILAGAYSDLFKYSMLLSPISSSIYAVAHVVRYRYVIISMLIICVISFAVGRKLIISRKNECAEQYISSKVLISFDLAAMTVLSFIIYSYGEFTRSQLLLYFFLSIVTVLILSIVLCAVLYHKPMKKYIAISLSVSSVFCVIYVSILMSGFGSLYYKTPQVDEVESVSVNLSFYDDYNPINVLFTGYSYNNNGDKTKFTDKESIEKIISVENGIIEDSKDKIYQSNDTIKITYKKNDGSKVTKVYSNYLENEYKIQELKEYKNQQSFIANVNKDNLINVQIVESTTMDYIVQTPNTSQKYDIYEAFKKDYMAQDAKTIRNAYMDSTGITVNIYYKDDNASDETKKKLSTMSDEELIQYYNESNASEIGIIVDSVTLTVNSKNMLSVMEKYNFINKITPIEQVNKNNIKAVYYYDVQYIKGEETYFPLADYNIVAQSLDEVFLIRPLVNLNDYSGEYWKKADDNAVNSIYDRLNQKANQATLFKTKAQKSNENYTGYAVTFLLKNNTVTKTYFVDSIEE